MGALDAASSTVLFLVFGERNALDVATVGKGDHARLVGDEVLERNFVFVGDDLGAAHRVLLAGELLLDEREVVLDDLVDASGVGEDGLEIGDLCEEFGEFVLELLHFEAGELVETHLEDCIHLCFGECETLDERGLCLFAVLRSADYPHDFVKVGDCENQAVQNVLACFGLAEFEARTARDDVETMVGVALEEVLEIEDLRSAAVDCEHVGAERRLEFRVLVEIVEDDLPDGVALELDHDADVGLRFVADVGDSLDDLLLDEVRHVDDHFTLVDGVGDFGDDDALASVLVRFDGGLSANAELSATIFVHGRDSVVAANLRAGREVRTLHELHQVVDRAFGIVDVVRDAVAEFAEVVRRNVRRHADRDAGRTVEKEVRELCRQNGRFLGRFVVVGDHVDGLFLEIVEHFLGDLLHAHFGVTHGGGAVAVDGTEVSVTVHERAAEREVLRHADNRVVHSRIAVRVVLTDHVTDDTRTLQVLGVPRVVEHVHRVQTAPVYGLETVAHVGKGAADNYRHRVVDVVACHLVFNVDILQNAGGGGLFGDSLFVQFFCHLELFCCGFEIHLSNKRYYTIFEDYMHPRNFKYVLIVAFTLASDERPYCQLHFGILPTSFRNSADFVLVYWVGIGNTKAHPSTQADLCTWIHLNPPHNVKKKAVKKKKAKK